MATDNPTILVIGATGYLGGPIVPRLLAEGWHTRLLVRDPDAIRDRFGRSVEVVRGDVTDEASVDRALNGCSAVYISLQARIPAEFDRVEHQGTSTVAKIAARQGIERLIYLSGALVSQQTSYVPQEGAKWHAEQAIERSGVPYTIFRPTYFMESLPLSVRGKRATVMGPATRKLRFVALDDYLTLVIQALKTPASANQRLDVYGPQAMTMREAMDTFVRLVDPTLKVSQTPFMMLRVLNALFMRGALTPVIDLAEMTEKFGESGTGDLTTRLVGTPSTTLEQWCATYRAQRETASSIRQTG
ncbi:MAG: NAD(P)H-binding protein [Anaerolineae bacterium]|nr:NAD(P)H-binding protein [Anaerolineae bacterium]